MDVLAFDVIYNAYVKKSTYKYYIAVYYIYFFEGGCLFSCLFALCFLVLVMFLFCILLIFLCVLIIPTHCFSFQVCTMMSHSQHVQHKSSQLTHML